MVNRFILRKIFIISIAILILIIVVIKLVGINNFEKPPDIKIMSDINGNPITYEILLNQWNRNVYDRLGYSEVLAKKVESGEVPIVDINKMITFDFGRNKPDNMNLIVDFNTNPIWSYQLPTIEVPLDNMSFNHPQPPSDYPLSNSIRFYVLTCSWGDNEAEYAFVVDTHAEQNSLKESSSLEFSINQISWMEISPRMGLTTYVDDDFYIEKIFNLLDQAELKPATEKEIADKKTSQPNPSEVTLGGYTYTRSLLIEFVQSINEKKETKILGSVLLSGDLVRINDNYYVSSSVTDDIIAILHDIYIQGKEKSAIEILQ